MYAALLLLTGIAPTNPQSREIPEFRPQFRIFLRTFMKPSVKSTFGFDWMDGYYPWDRHFINLFEFFFTSTEGALRLPTTYDNQSHPIPKRAIQYLTAENHG